MMENTNAAVLNDEQDIESLICKVITLAKSMNNGQIQSLLIPVKEIFESQAFGLDFNVNVKHDLGPVSKTIEYVNDKIFGVSEFHKKMDRDNKNRAVDTDELSDYMSCRDEFKSLDWIDIVKDYVFNDKLLLSLIAGLIVGMAVAPNRITAICLLITISIYMFKNIRNILNSDKFDFVFALFEKTSEVVVLFEENPDIDMEEIQTPQSVEETVPIFVEALVGIFSLCSGYKARAPLTKVVETFLKTTEKTKGSITLIISKCFILISKFFTDIVKNETLAEYFHVEVISDKKVRDVLEKICEYNTACNTGSIQCGGFGEAVYEQLYTEVNDLLKICEKTSYDYRSLSIAFGELKRCYADVKIISKSLKSSRVEPVGVIFKGAPNTKKTILMDRIAKLVGSLTVPKMWEEDFDVNPDDYIFPVPQGKFFDGYTYKSWIATMDDIFQRRECVGAEDPDSLRVISFINSSPFPLNMAAVEKKNTTFFRSPFFMATSNVTNFQLLNAVSSPAAVARRFNITVTVTVNPKYSIDGKDDLSKFPTSNLQLGDEFSTEHTVIPDDYWVLSLEEYSNGSFQEARIVSLEDLVEIIIESHHKKIMNFYINKNADVGSFLKTKDAVRNRLAEKNRIIPAWFIDTNPGDELRPQSFEISDDQHHDNISDFLFERGFGRTIMDKRDMFYLEEIVAKIAYMEKVDGKLLFDYEDLSWMYDDDQFIVKKFVSSMDYEMLLRIYFNALQYSDMSGLFDRDMSLLKNILSTCPKVTLVEFFYAFRSHETFRYFVMSVIKEKVNEGIDLRTMKHKSFFNRSKSDLKYHSKVFSTNIQKLFNVEALSSVLYILTIGIQVLLAIVTFKVLRKIMKALYRFFFPARESAFEEGNNNVVVNPIGVQLKVVKDNRNCMSRFVSEMPSVPQSINVDAFCQSKLPTFTAPDLGGRSGSNDIMVKVHNQYLFIVYLVAVIDGEVIYKRIGHVLNVYNDYFLSPFHYIYMISYYLNKHNVKEAEVILMTPSKRTIYRKTASDFLESFRATDESANRDVCVLKIDGAQPGSLGALRYVITDSDLKSIESLTSFDTTLMGCAQIGEMGSALLLRIHKMKSRFRTDPVVVRASWADNNSIYKLEHTIEYRAPLSNGDCGSLLCFDGMNFQNRIIMGIHTAGVSDKGTSSYITKEFIMKMMKELNLKQSMFSSEEEIDDIVLNGVLDSQSFLQPMGTVLNSPATVTSSEIIKSQFYGKLPGIHQVVRTRPSRMFTFTDKDGNIIDPRRLALSNYVNQPGCIPDDYMMLATADYCQLIMQKSVHYNRPRIVYEDIEEIIKGFGNVKPIASSTSAGYPMSAPGAENLKKDYYAAIAEGNVTLTASILEKIKIEVENTLDKYKSGVRPFFAYTDNLKDEKRPIEKALVGKTRLFSGSPFILLILFRKYFGAFADAFFEMNIDVGSAIGVNPYSDNWDFIYRKLAKFGTREGKVKVGAGDYARYDCKLVALIMMAILEIINDWYGGTKEESDMRTWLWQEIINSKHIFDKEYYVWTCSLPSGNPLTAIINTMCNNLIYRLAWLFNNNQMSEFTKNVYLICFGDDSLFSVSEKYSAAFNELVLPSLMKFVGMEYTTESKGAASVDFRNIEDIEFLKRSFRKIPHFNRWIAPLREESIFEMLNWTKKQKRKGGKIITPAAVAVDNLGVALRELSLHPEEMYNRYTPELLKICRRVYPGEEMNFPYSPSYDVMQNMTLQTEFEY